MFNPRNHNGYSIIELLAVIVIISIISSVSMKSLKSATDTSKAERTKKEMDQLAYAIAGDPNLQSGGTRTDFGYVGDVGGLPPNLSALVNNPGGYSTWNGPYLHDDFLTSVGGSNTEFQIDEWGKSYSYTGSTITSTGSGTALTRAIANSVNDLLYNSVSVVVVDMNNTPPGLTYKDSLKILLSIPDGVGGTTTVAKVPGADGFVQIDSIPVGQHRLRVVYIPDSDTLQRTVTVNPGTAAHITTNWYKQLW